MSKFFHVWHYDGRDITFSWLGDVNIQESRIHAFAFSEQGKMLLVGGTKDGGYWLPGGGIEIGESPEIALRREMMEEAAATVNAMKKLGIQKTFDPLSGESYQSFYWCRITLAENFIPEHEVTERLLVDPDQFLNTLFWGRKDPKAEMLFNMALDLNRLHGPSIPNVPPD